MSSDWSTRNTGVSCSRNRALGTQMSPLMWALEIWTRVLSHFLRSPPQTLVFLSSSFLLLCLLRQGLTMQHSLDRQARLTWKSQRSLCLWFLSAGIKGVPTIPHFGFSLVGWFCHNHKVTEVHFCVFPMSRFTYVKDTNENQCVISVHLLEWRNYNTLQIGLWNDKVR